MYAREILNAQNRSERVLVIVLREKENLFLFLVTERVSKNRSCHNQNLKS
jgi:hypothetical protein